MNSSRRCFAGLVLGAVLFLAGCAGQTPAADPQARAALAPTGVLRVGIYPGSPTSLVRDAKTGEGAGVAHDLGMELGRQLGVPVKMVEFVRIAQVLDAIKAQQVDFSFTNATESRARDVDFTAPLIRLELGYLVPPGSAIAAPGDVDRPGVRVGVTQGSTSQSTLTRQLKSAQILPAASLKQAQEMLQAHAIDVYATNKGILFEMTDELPPGYRVLDGAWGLESLAIAFPKGRDAGKPFLSNFARQMQASGRLQAISARAGLRGIARAE
ncbi:MAG TPA: transporter substrate-binding domain-containing protein [Ramlibacter sp.]|nr:transporter substrate-binding domain-containing protein [Ramlibacter sp.]